MNKHVIRAMILLMWLFFFIFVSAKCVFPEQFLAVVQNERIIAIGEFIDSHWFWTLVANIVLSLFSAHFYFCGCKHVWMLSPLQRKIIYVYVVGIAVGYARSTPNTALIDLCLLILIPLLFRAKLSQTIAMFTFSQIGQILTLYLRSEDLFLLDTNYATRTIMFFDAQIWLVLYYLYSNLHKEESLWVCLFSPFSGTCQKKSSEKSLKRRKRKSQNLTKPESSSESQSN